MTRIAANRHDEARARRYHMKASRHGLLVLVTCQILETRECRLRDVFQSMSFTGIDQFIMSCSSQFQHMHIRKVLFVHQNQQSPTPRFAILKHIKQFPSSQLGCNIPSFPSPYAVRDTAIAASSPAGCFVHHGSQSDRTPQWYSKVVFFPITNLFI